MVMKVVMKVIVKVAVILRGLGVCCLTDKQTNI